MDVDDVRPPAGWVPDPLQRAPLRYWSGTGWTDWISDGHTVSADPRPLRRRLESSDLPHLRFVEDVFLPEARGQKLISPRTAEQLTVLARGLQAEVGGRRLVGPAPAAPAVITSTGIGEAPRQAETQRVTDPGGTTWPTVRTGETRNGTAQAQPSLRAAQDPGPVSQWWARSRSAFGSELAVHGLAYLGVLLLFVGAFGLVVFAFGDVAPRLRPVAELVIAVAPFGAAALLLRRGAVVAGRALEVAGGLLVPVVLVTTFLDGFAIPPDLAGVPLAVTLTVGSALVTVAYAWWSRRHRASALRYLVGPLTWFTVAMGALGLGRDIPTGKDVATPGSAQVAAIAFAVLVTLVLARARPAGFLAEPTQVSAVTGSGLLAVMALLTWAAEGWPPLAIGATGVLLLGALHLLRPRLPLAVVATVGPVWTLVVGLSLGVDLEPALAGSLVLLAYAVLVEVAGSARWPRWTVALPAVGAVGALMVTWDEPWWAFGAFAATAGWAVARRVRPYDVPAAGLAFDVGALVLPLAALAALGTALDVPTALAAGAGLALLVTVPATRPMLRRADTADDSFWSTAAWLWLAVVAGVTFLFVAAQGAVFDPARDGWLVTGTFAVLAAAAAAGPSPRLARPWIVLGLAGSAWLVACQTAAIPDLVRGSVLAVAGLALVAGAHATTAALGRDLQAHLGLAGHLLGAVAVTASGTRWGLVASLGLATAGWTMTAERDRTERSPVAAAIGRLGDTARYLPPVLAGAGLPVTVALALDRAGVLTLDDPWVVWVPATTGLVYAFLSRIRLGDRLELTSAWGGFLAALLAVASATSRLTVAVGLAAVIATVALVAALRRSPVMVWAAWAAVAPLVGVVAAELSAWFEDLPVETQVSAVLVVVGGGLLVGGWTADLLGRPWVARRLPASASLLPVVTLGAAELAAGLLGAMLVVTGEAGGWLAAGTAGILLVVGLLTRAGVLGGAAALLGWYAAVRLAPAELETRPWVAVLVAAVLLLSAGLLTRRTARAAAWSRWDLWMLVAAAPVASTALLQALDGDFFTLTFVLVGLECGAAAVGLPRWPAIRVSLGLVAALLILVGAADAGEGWLSVTLLALSVASSVMAALTSGPARLALQASGAVLASLAWLVALSWFGWSAAVAVDVTAVGAGVLTLVAASALLVSNLDASWSKVWGGAGAVLTMTVAVAAEGMRADGDAAEPSWWVVTGMVLATIGTGMAAAPLAWAWLRDLAAAFAVATALTALQAWEASAPGQVAALVVLSLVCGLAGLALTERPAFAVWRRPALELGAATATAAVVVAAGELPERMLLVPSLAASSLQAATLGVALRLLWPQLLSPLLACAAWWAFASEALDGNPQWYTVPIGLSLLVAVGLWRRHRLLNQANPTAPEIVGLELAGIGFLVGAAFVQAVTEVVGYAALAAALGIGVAGWGLVTRVRRRLAAGVVTVAGALVVFVVVPMVRLLPAWEGAWLWLLIGAIGVVALLAATVLEEGRELVQRGMRRFGQMTEHWE
jgi:hypothetical protein